MADASPQPKASIQPTRIPTSRLDVGFCAAARMASPSGVKRKNAYSSNSTTSVMPIAPSSCDETNGYRTMAARETGWGRS